jgi:SAM-dependent methyltransferase
LEPFALVTPAAQWSYALSCALPPAVTTSEGAIRSDVRFAFDVSVMRGRVGLGVTNPDGTAFVIERHVSSSDVRITIAMSAGQRVGRLVFRNVAPSNLPSELVVKSVRVEEASAAERRYPVTVAARGIADEAVPTDGGVGIVFDTDAAAAINAARIEWLAQAGLPLDGARVLDAGCGVGHFISFYAMRGCTVVAVDGRPENVAELRRRHPHVEAHIVDVQHLDPQAFGVFDVIHCFGLLYHLDSPVAALRNLSAMCGRLLVLETMVCDSSRPVAVLVDETRSASQALAGMGSRPSPAFIVFALSRVGFNYVYGAKEPPRHPEFEFDWRDNLDTTRDGHPLRCVLVASREPLDSVRLVPLLDV